MNFSTYRDGIIALVIWVVIVGALFYATVATAAVSPMVWPECQSRELISDLRDAGASSVEIDAIRAITRDGRSKGPLDYVQVEYGGEIFTVLGWAHFPARSGRLGLLPPRPYESDLDHYWTVLSYLYSDHAPANYLREWRRVVGPSDEEARRNGWEGKKRVLGLAIANSSPRLLVRLGNDCHWQPECVAEEYGSGSAHRQRRMTFLGYR